MSTVKEIGSGGKEAGVNTPTPGVTGSAPSPTQETVNGNPNSKSLINMMNFEELETLVNKLVDIKLNKYREMEKKSQESRETEIKQSSETAKKSYADCVSLKETIKQVTDTEKQVQVQIVKLHEMSEAIRSEMKTEQTARTIKEELESKKLRERSLIIRGLTESKNENMYDEITDLLDSGKCELSIENVENAYRVGKKSENGQNNYRPRNVKLVLKVKQHKRYLYDITRALKGTRHYKNVRFEPDQNSAEMLQSRTVQQVANLARETNNFKQIRMRGCDILIDDTLYKPNDMDKLPGGLSPEKAAKREYDWGQAFQGHNSPFSNFYPCKINSLLNNGKTYSSAEKYFAILMAEDHGLTGITKQIERIDNPYYIKAITNSIVKSNTWKEKAEGLLEKIVTAKFSQNPEIRKLLVESKGKLIEATKCPNWGCGLFLHETKRGNVDLAGYQNKMGKLLVRVRTALKQ